MKAVAVTDRLRVSIIDVPAPSGDGTALVSVDSSGLCGTDLKILRGEIPVALPRVLGHEVVGHVQQAGPRGLVPEGTRVLVDPYAPCGRCHGCLNDREHLCPGGSLMGRDVDGGLTQTVEIAESRLHAIPDAIDDRSACLLQVLGTCIHAQDRITARPTATVVVLGLGVSGLLHVQLLRDRGVGTVIGVTRSEPKRVLAEALGATATASPAGASALVAELTEGRGADVVVECAGAPAALSQAIELTAPGGQVLLFGITSHAPDLPLYQLYFKELELVGSRAARGADYARGIELAAAKRLDLAALWTDSFPLQHAALALTRLEQQDALKVTLEMT